MASDTHEVKIEITGSAESAVGALENLKKALGSVSSEWRKAIGYLNGFISAFGKIHWVIEAFKSLKEVISNLHDWIHRDEIAAKALNEELAKASYAAAVAHAAANYEKLNKSLAETLRLEKERSAILEKRKSYSRDIEDAKLEARKQLEISSLDPAATDYAARKSAIERKYSSLVLCADASSDIGHYRGIFLFECLDRVRKSGND